MGNKATDSIAIAVKKENHEHSLILCGFNLIIQACRHSIDHGSYTWERKEESNKHLTMNASWVPFWCWGLLYQIKIMFPTIFHTSPGVLLDHEASFLGYFNGHFSSCLPWPLQKQSNSLSTIMFLAQYRKPLYFIIYDVQLGSLDPFIIYLTINY